MGKFQITAVKHSLVAFLLLIIAKTTIQQDRIDLQDTIDVLVEGPPRYILEQANSPGYLATIILLLPKHGKRVPLHITEGETADHVAASFFRHYSLAFGPQYIPVHNTIASVLKKEAAPADISHSKVVPSEEPPHPYLAAADERKSVFLTATLKLAQGRKLDGVQVLEGERPEAALARWEADMLAKQKRGERKEDENSERGREDAVVFASAAERAEAVEQLANLVADTLIAEEAVFRRTSGPNAEMEALFPSSKTLSPPLSSPLPPDADPGWEEREEREEREEERDAREVQRMLFQLQNPDSCNGRRVVVASMDRAIWGLAVNVHYLTLLLNYCLVHNRTLLTANPDYWNYAGGWCRSGWECFFEPLSGCAEAQVWEPYTSDIRDDIQFDYRSYLYQVDTSSERALYFSNTDGPWLELLNRPEYKNYIPPNFKHRSLLWWRAQLTKFVFRPKKFVSEFVHARRSAVQWHAGLVGLHVRHGDKSWDVAHQGSYIGGLAPYLAKAEALCSRIASGSFRRGPRYVGCSDPAVASRPRYFISTDDASVLSEARAQQLSATWDNVEARFNGTHVYAPMGVSEKRWPGFPGNDPAVHTLRYALESIKSIVLLAEARLFVGTATSCFSRLVLQLRVAQRRHRAHPGDDSWTVDADPRHGPGWFVDP